VQIVGYINTNKEYLHGQIMKFMQCSQDPAPSQSIQVLTHTACLFQVNFNIILPVLCRTSVSNWINWTNLMSLYESFLFLNMFRMLLHSSSGADDCMCVCVCTALFWCVVVYWCGSAGVGWYPNAGWSTTCHYYHQYTSRHRNRAVHPHAVVSSWGWM
jgi:hypothetical protein